MDLKEKRKLDDGGKDQPLGPVSKQRKVIGPSLPLPQQIADATSQASSDDDDDDDDDDDFGPSLPPSDPSGGLMQATSTAVDVASTAITTDLGPETQRDQWMLQPPSQSDWSSKVDPTQLRTRKFNTGKSATAPKQMDSAWVETPEQRMRRLQDAVMGIGPSTCQTATPLRTSKTQSMEDQIKKYKDMAGENVRLDKPGQAQGEDDDPSRRAFDREKDMSLSSKISSAQRREMVKRAADYNTRFTKGNFL